MPRSLILLYHHGKKQVRKNVPAPCLHCYYCTASKHKREYAACERPITVFSYHHRKEKKHAALRSFFSRSPQSRNTSSAISLQRQINTTARSSVLQLHDRRLRAADTHAGDAGRRRQALQLKHAPSIPVTSR